eukprot:TRINITY_DN10604_c0_g1_i1.p1 TRINITY_DN10604_c0_g1~~TRINITY_DN10604_c0_g1_i1.p1  ORF type:complete len:394 (+),score=86.94 TRINITY_DN10604_c0_g1_i1:112-1293(+)
MCIRDSHLTGRALIPGLVNAHSHAFQRGLRGRGEVYPANSGESSFWTWRQEMYKLVASLDSSSFFELSKQCFSEMRASGITSVGEFHYFHHDNDVAFAFDEIVVRAAREAGVRIVLLNAYYEFGGFNDTPLNASQQRFETNSLEGFWKQMDRLSSVLDPKRGEALGVVAHSIRAVALPTVKALHTEAKNRDLVFHMHVEEQPKEIEDCKSALGMTPMAALLSQNLVDERFTAVHCTHSSREDLAEFAKKGGNVCICPLTEGNLADGIFDHMELCGGQVSLGTDCNARIDMIEEMRWLEYGQRVTRQTRGVSCASSGEADLAKHLLDCATINGAKALNLDSGAIEAGKWADFAVVDLNSAALSGWDEESLLGAVVFGSSTEAVLSGTCVGGRWN